MGERINDLEKHVADLMAEAGIENTDDGLRVKKAFSFLVVFHLFVSVAT